MDRAEALLDRAQGAMLGLALGDAYGRPLELLRGESVRTLPVDTSDLRWTDDTQLTLYLAKAILDTAPGPLNEEVLGHAIGRRFVEWSHDPATPSLGPGAACLRGAAAYERSRDWRGSQDPRSDGCGAVMRVLPVALAFAEEDLVAAARLQASVTHRHENAVDGAAVTARLVRAALSEARLDAGLVRLELAASREAAPAVLSALEQALAFADQPGARWLDEGIGLGDGGHRSPSALGLAVASVLAWGQDFATCIDRAARIDGDSDSVAAIAGMLLGASGGTGALPAAWLAGLQDREELRAMATRLVHWGEVPEGRPPRTSLTDPIEVAWLPTPGLSGRIGLTFAPGKRSPSTFGVPWRRDLDLDLERLAGLHEVRLLVPLLEDHELDLLQIPRLEARAHDFGIRVRRLPIVDGGVPLAQAVGPLIREALRVAAEGSSVCFHCRGGLGRAGTLAALALVELGQDPEQAIEAVRAVRPGAIENLDQERFILHYQASTRR